MRSQNRSISRQTRAAADEALLERKARELVAPDDEIEAWELDSQDLGSMRIGNDYLNARGSE